MSLTRILFQWVRPRRLVVWIRGLLQLSWMLQWVTPRSLIERVRRTQVSLRRMLIGLLLLMLLLWVMPRRLVVWVRGLQQLRGMLRLVSPRRLLERVRRMLRGLLLLRLLVTPRRLIMWARRPQVTLR